MVEDSHGGGIIKLVVVNLQTNHLAKQIFIHYWWGKNPTRSFLKTITNSPRIKDKFGYT